MKTKGFTLAETLIVVIVIGILAVILMKTYTFISEISFRIQQEKNLTQDTLFLSQTIQNLSDRNSIDYDRYNNTLGLGYLISQNGLTDTLYLKGQDGNIKIYSTGDCLYPGEYISQLNAGQECILKLEKNGEISDITNSKTLYITKTFFKIIPYDSYQNYMNDISTCTNYISCIHKQGFFMISKAYSPSYNNNRYNRIQISIEQFFNSINTNE